MKAGKRRSVSVAALASVTALLLSACGGGSGGQSQSTNDGGAASDGGDKVTIEFWHRTFTPVENEWYEQIVEDFNSSQDRIFVNDTEIPADAWDQRMKAAQAAGNAPDIYTQAGSIEDAVNAGQLHELNGIVSDEALGQIIDSALPVSAIGDKFYAYPLLLEPQTVLFWNKSMLEAAGLDPEVGPSTWQDLMDACAAIKPTLTAGQFCISPAGDAPTFAWSTVGQQFNFSGHTALNAEWTEPNINDQGYKDLMQAYKDLWDNDYMPKQPLGPYVEGRDFGEGKVAFKVSGSWMMSEIGSDFPDVLGQTGIGAFPNAADADGRTATTMGNFKWVVDAKSKNAEAAGEFLEWSIAGDPANLVPFFVETQFTKVPVRMSVQEAVSADAAAADAPWSAIILNDVAPNAIPEPSYPWDVSLAVGTAIEKVMKGAASADDAIKTAEDEIRVVIEREDLPAKAPSEG